MERLESGHFFGEGSSLFLGHGLLVSETRYEPGTTLPAHEHLVPYICVVTAGAFTERVAGHSDVCQRGTIVVHPAGEIHSNRFDASGTCLNVQIGPEWLDRESGALTPRKRLVFSSDHGLRLANEIQREVRDAFRGFQLATQGLAMLLVAHVSRSTLAPKRKRSNPIWLRRATDRLSGEWLRPPDLRTLAAECGVHPVTLCRAFQRNLGCTPAGFVRRIRLERAMAALRNPNVRLSEVAVTSGFFDQAHLTRTMRRACGQTPAQYRRGLFASASDQLHTLR